MNVHIIWRISALLFLIVCFFIISSRSLRRNEEADFNFQITMGKDINRIVRELKKTELDEKTIHVLEYALHDVQRNTESYVQRRTDNQFFSLIFLVPMFLAFGTFGNCYRQKKVMP